MRARDEPHETGVTLVTFAPERTAVEDGFVESVLAAVVFLLLIGAIVGNLYASRRRKPPDGPSVYDVIRSRLEAERAGKRPPE
jgi:hypothetical protein